MEQDFTGSPTIIDNRYKLVIIGSKELFDLQEDPVETNNLFKEKTEIAAELEVQLRDWQQSVLESLTGADYQI